MVRLVDGENILAARLAPPPLVVVARRPTGAAARQLALAWVTTTVGAAGGLAVVEALWRQGHGGAGPAFFPLCDLEKGANTG